MKPADEALGLTAEAAAEGEVAAAEAVAEVVGEVEAADAFEEAADAVEVAAAEATARPGAPVAEAAKIQALVVVLPREIPVQIAETAPVPRRRDRRRQKLGRSWAEAGAADVSAPMEAEAGAADVSAPVALPLPWVMVRASVDRLQRRDVRLESFSLGALSLRDPAPSQVEVIGVELDVDGLAPAQELRVGGSRPGPERLIMVVPKASDEILHLRAFSTGLRTTE